MKKSDITQKEEVKTKANSVLVFAYFEKGSRKMNRVMQLTECIIVCGICLSLFGCAYENSNDSNKAINHENIEFETQGMNEKNELNQKIIEKLDENLYIDATLSMPDVELNQYITKLKKFELDDILTYIYPDSTELERTKDDVGGISYGDSYIGGDWGSLQYSKDENSSYMQMICGYANDKKLAEKKDLQFESVAEAKNEIIKLVDKLGIGGELGKEEIIALNSEDLANVQKALLQDTDFKELLDSKKQQKRIFADDTEVYYFKYGFKIDTLPVYSTDDPILQQSRDVIIAQPMNIEIMISNSGIEMIFVSGAVEKLHKCNENNDVIGKEGIQNALEKKFGDVILTDEFRVVNIWMEYFPLLQDDSFTEIKIIPVWCLDFQVNGFWDTDSGYTLRINAITGDEVS